MGLWGFEPVFVLTVVIVFGGAIYLAFRAGARRRGIQKGEGVPERPSGSVKELREIKYLIAIVVGVVVVGLVIWNGMRETQLRECQAEKSADRLADEVVGQDLDGNNEDFDC
jgi:hypothetical protein